MRTTVAVLGAGKIGEVLLSGLLRAGWPVGRLIATTRRPERAAELTERYGIRPTSNLTAVTQADVLLVAVKPQDAGRLLDEFGMKVPVGDPAALAKAIRLLADDPRRRAALGAAARERVEARFSVGAMAAQLARLYEDVSSRRP